MTAHLALVKKRVHDRMSLLRRVAGASTVVSAKNMKTLFSALVGSVIDYAAPAYLPALSKRNRRSLDKLTREA